MAKRRDEWVPAASAQREAWSGEGQTWARVELRSQLLAVLLEQEGLGMAAAASALGVSRQALYNVLDDKTPLTVAMAARIERVFGVDARALLALQLEDQLIQARRELVGSREVVPFKRSA